MVRRRKRDGLTAAPVMCGTVIRGSCHASRSTIHGPRFARSGKRWGVSRGVVEIRTAAARVGGPKQPAKTGGGSVMTEERMLDLVRKSAEPDFLRELLQHTVQRLTECERANQRVLDTLRAELQHTVQRLMECAG